MQVHRRISAASLGVLVAVLSIAFYIWSCKQAVSLGYSQSDFSVAKVHKSWSIPEDCFVQGLAVLNSTHLVLSCGGYGTSRLLLLTGFSTESISVAEIYKSDNDVFLEGCTVVKGTRLIVLTWREGLILEFDIFSKTLTRTFDYEFEGWGIAYADDRNELWASDGSSVLRVLDPTGMRVIRECSVWLSIDGHRRIEVKYMNELEFVGGRLFANIYIPAGIPRSPNYVVAIDPDSCYVTRVYPAFDLNVETDSGHVMNGISSSLSGDSGEIFVTGKHWNAIHLLRLEAAPSSTPAIASHLSIARFLSMNLSFR